MRTKTFMFPGINPQPWEIGPVGWRTVAGKKQPAIGPSPQLKTYQKALKTELEKMNLSPATFEKVRLEFYFWRRLDTHKSFAGNKPRDVVAKVSDSTNMQKATEDALQGYLLINDRQVKDIRSVIVEEGPDVDPGVIVKMILIEESSPINVSPEMLAEFAKQREGEFDPAVLDGLLKF
jgi:Holliday junction resolvase RusA-like endonuclease